MRQGFVCGFYTPHACFNRNSTFLLVVYDKQCHKLPGGNPGDLAIVQDCCTSVYSLIDKGNFLKASNLLHALHRPYLPQLRNLSSLDLVTYQRHTCRGGSLLPT
jgi:hypothetical protein